MSEVKPLRQDHRARFARRLPSSRLFSLIKQSPSGAVRLAELYTLLDGMLTEDDIRALVGQLQELTYLQPGRTGEWRAGDRLNRLADQRANPHQSLSLYSNIKSSEGRKVEIRDQHTQQTIARVDAQWLDRGVLTLEGRAVDVEWFDGEAMWVRASRDQEITDKLRYTSARQLLSYDLAQKLAVESGLAPGDSPLIECPLGWLWYHWLGDLYGRALHDLVGQFTPIHTTNQIGLCVLPSAEPQPIPLALTRLQIVRYLEDNYLRFEPMLDLGPYHHLLPTPIRRRSVIEQFDVDRFQAAVGGLKLFRASESLAAVLQTLLVE